MLKECMLCGHRPTVVDVYMDLITIPSGGNVCHDCFDEMVVYLDKKRKVPVKA